MICVGNGGFKMTSIQTDRSAQIAAYVNDTQRILYPSRDNMYISTVNPGQRTNPGNIQITYGNNNPTINTSNYTPQIRSQAQASGGDGEKDDGKIGFWSATGHFLKGCVKLFTGMFTDENGHPSLTQTLKTAAFASLCFIPGVAPAALALGAAFTTCGLVNGIINMAEAENDAQDKQAWEDIGTNALGLFLTFVGAKSYAKANAGANGVDPARYDGFRGSFRAVGRTITDTYRNVSGGFSNLRTASVTNLKKLKTTPKGQRMNAIKRYASNKWNSAINKTINGAEKIIGKAGDIGSNISQKYTDVKTYDYKGTYSSAKGKLAKGLRHPFKATKYVGRQIASKYNNTINNPKTPRRFGTLIISSTHKVDCDEAA